MAIYLKQQTRVFTSQADDNAQFGDGAPMHSHIGHDLVRALNNGQTYCDPFYQFAFDSCHSSSGNGVSRLRYTRPTGYAAAGYALLGQMPIMVPPQAKRFRFVIGVYRLPASFESALGVDIVEADIYLAAGPCTGLADFFPNNLAPVETARLFDEKYIKGDFAKFQMISTLPAEVSDTSTQYHKLRNDSVISPPGTLETAMITPDNINARSTNAWTMMIIVVGFQNMLVNESLRLGEVCTWWEFE